MKITFFLLCLLIVIVGILTFAMVSQTAKESVVSTMQMGKEIKDTIKTQEEKLGKIKDVNQDGEVYEKDVLHKQNAPQRNQAGTVNPNDIKKLLSNYNQNTQRQMQEVERY